MPLDLKRIVDISEHGEVRYKQSAPTLHFQLDKKDFGIHPLDMPLYFGDTTDKEQFNFLARTVSQLGVYFRHGLKNIPDREDQGNRRRRERKLKATHETQLALMTLAPLLKLNRYSQCTRQEFNAVIAQVRERIDKIFAGDDVINNALKTIIEHRLDRIADAAGEEGNVDVTALHLYSDVVDLSEALLEGLQEKANLEYDNRDTRTVRRDNLYKNIQNAKDILRNPQHQRRGHGKALNRSNFGLFGPSSDKKAHEEQQEAADQEEEKETYYLNPAHYRISEANIAKDCDYLEAIGAQVKEEIKPAQDLEHTAKTSVDVDTEETPLLKPSSTTDLTQAEANRDQQVDQQATLAEQLKDKRSEHEPTKASATRNSWYLHRAGANNLLAAGPAAFAIAGATIGTIFPVVGTAIGAIVGAGVGYLAAATHHAIAVEEKKNGGYFVEPAKRLAAGLAAPITYVVNAAEVAARPVIRWGQKALFGWGSTKHPKLEIVVRAGRKLDLELPDIQADEANRGEEPLLGPAKAKKPAVAVAVPTQLTLDTGGGFSSIPAATALFTRHIANPLAAVFRSNPTIGLFLHGFLWGPLGLITAFKAVGLSHLSHIELSVVKAYNYVSNMFSGSTGFVGSMWSWIVPGKFLELIILDPLVNPLKQTELFGHFFERLEEIKDDPHHRRDVFVAKQLMQTVLMLALTGAAANLAAPLIAEAFKAVGMEVDFGSNPIGQAWNNVLVMTKGSALATSMMLFNNQPEHIMRDTTAVLASIIKNHGEDGKKHVQNICNNLKKLQQLSPAAYASLSKIKKSQIRACFHDLKKVFGVELMYALVPGEKFGIRPPAPTNALGKVVNWAVSVPMGICRGLRHPIAVGLPAVANFVAGMLEFATVIKQSSGIATKVIRGNIFTRQVAKRLPGFGGNEQEVANNLRAKYDNQRPERNWLLSPLKSFSRAQHWVQRGLTNLMHRCTAYAMAGKNTLPKSPDLAKEELKGITGLEGHPLIQGDGFGREPEPGRDQNHGPDLLLASAEPREPLTASSAPGYTSFAGKGSADSGPTAVTPPMPTASLAASQSEFAGNVSGDSISPRSGTGPGVPSTSADLTAQILASPREQIQPEQLKDGEAFAHFEDKDPGVEARAVSTSPYATSTPALQQLQAAEAAPPLDLKATAQSQQAACG
ncbi:hypothetical protein [Piscirickettsia salmonis]|uniref:Uncharacterized protein n=1 Tax=Piscirickettsia salmonis TaxID=1238 RepID=A0A9Q5VIZ2_PISSA|nr:hypothetical protein [Piscirickettsia salmonis]ALA25737.1 hypothetical protein KW89_2273 [Piscirickettsia salmonis]APS43225.1 hypothetical protein AVI48_01740 [Piscirickettsia salmonis]APS46574.1 hypothetical protein AVI49_02340 [Piscirickettsia salmonis]APS56814.1 hypothetical protein AVI52_05865 [Piscirickettsia salmonis]ERL63288.1 hypothetical protein K661_00312 [Piscirickettsia salmonis LF-89 = ATCC VR-1361]